MVSPAPHVPEGAATPSGRETRYREPEPPEPLINPDMIGAALPAAAMAGTMAMAALPMIANALGGLTGGGGGDQGGNGGGSTDGELSPESQHALEALELLAKVYGDEETDDPEIQAIREELGLTPGNGTGTGTAGSGAGSAGSGSIGAGSGATANAVNARQLFQRNAATAFNNIDNQLLRYITGLAGNNKVDQKAIGSLVREVNVALAQLGPQAYTAQGQQKVRQILTAALQRAHTIVSGSNTNSTDTANAINRLTNQYLYNISGQNYSAAMGTSGGQMPGGTLGQWIQQAMAVLQQSGCDMRKVDPAAIAIIIQNESDGNPLATNTWDGNAARGTPSKGLMQTIDSTFNQYAVQGYNNIYNPVHNIVAGVRYAIGEYGSVSNVPGVRAVRSGQKYVGY
ncbi:DUF4226 domain-containing protein [Nocardia sp. NPDC051463]|uniref:DUF4226 domain-containing protein n=1 Tax=Nocardia sp. NPDC051463 TaxID=3154845 RepID=UPI0034453736